MSKVILICGKLCCGKSTYSREIITLNNAVLLSVDEIMLTLFEQQVGEKHDEYTKNIQGYLFQKSAEIAKAGSNVVLDWGFWRKADRIYAKEFYKARGIDCEFHYLDISDTVWRQRIQYRNQLVLEGKSKDYFVDDNLMKKFDSIFEVPERTEIEVWV